MKQPFALKKRNGIDIIIYAENESMAKLQLSKIERQEEHQEEVRYRKNRKLMFKNY